MRLKILPYKMGSVSATALSTFFNTVKIREEGNYRPSAGDVIINWGLCRNVRKLNTPIITLLNKPEAVNNASDKVLTLTELEKHKVPHVEFSLTREGAIKFINDGNLVYCRTITRGKEGDGIIIAETEGDLPQGCRLFTKRFKNNEEYRIHVFNEKVIDRVRKRKMSEETMIANGIDPQSYTGKIKNFKKGWTFSRAELTVPEGIDELAINAVKALGLDFGGCDIARNSKTGEMVVLEVNSACGMETGTTTHARYCNAISKFLGIGFSLDDYKLKYNCTIEYGLLE